MSKATGYAHPAYAASLSEYFQPQCLPRSNVWILRQSVPGADATDALGGDPHLFCCDWDALAEDLENVDDLVSLTAVTEPFANVDESLLRRCFPELLRPYKRNFTIDLRCPQPTQHHRARARSARAAVETVVDEDPSAHADEWQRLYDVLRDRHDLQGRRSLSPAALRNQLDVPGCLSIRALADGVCVSMTIWYVMHDVAHFHLGASDETGYSLSASYALMEHAIEAFRARGLRWINLGATPGIVADNDNGLGRFKKGWSNGVRESYLCGRVFDAEKYNQLAADVTSGVDYFPRYRSGTDA